MVICLERGADLHIARLMPLPLTVSCFSKIQIGFISLVPAQPRSPGQRAVNRVCVCYALHSRCTLDAERAISWLHCAETPYESGPPFTKYLTIYHKII